MQYKLRGNYPIICGISKHEMSQLLESVKMVSKFAEHIPGEESYWTDLNGVNHTDDMGYVLQFLDNLIGYLEDSQKIQAMI